MTINVLESSRRFFYVVLLAAAISTTAHARQLDDVSLADSITIDGTDTPLLLNGMGYRTKFVFKIYVGALYTESKVTSRDAAQTLAGPKRVVMHILYDEVSHDKMADAWQQGFEENNSDELIEKLRPRLDILISAFPDLKAGDVVLLDYIPAKGTRLSINDKETAMIEGADFYRALLDVWLGEEPADDDLKAAMLGIDND